MKRLIALWLALAPSLAQAHDFWLDFGETYRARPGEVRLMRFLVGHAGESEEWTLRKERVVHFTHFGPSGAEDLVSALRMPGVKDPGGAEIAVSAAGSRLFAFESTPVPIELPAEKFAAYLREEGLTPAIAARKAERREEEPGREVYSRRAKAILQVGATATDTVSTPIGHTLEIVPERNPLLLGEKEPLPVRIYWRGDPLSGASVHLESLSVGIVPEQTLVTDGEGRAYFRFPHRGAWKLDVVWTEPIDDPQADFNTVFASLTFGY